MWRGRACLKGTEPMKSTTVWTDDTGAYFIRRDDGSSVTYVTPAGVAYTPGTGLRPAGGSSGGSYTLAAAISLAATTGGTSVTGVQTGSYIFAAVFTGTSVKLQALGPDGSTWVDVATQTGSGQQGVVLGNNASVRLYNPNGSGLTGLSASLS